jgi:hypothetical protein
METIGSLIDKLSINELKIYHMSEQQSRKDVEPAFVSECSYKISILIEQRNDLLKELDELIKDVLSGKKQFKVYRQMKMYNNKKYKD